MLFKRFFESQFKYCPLTWMFYSRNTINKINLLHERAFRLVYNDYDLPFEKLLEKDGQFTVHHYNIQRLCIEQQYKVYHNIAQTIFIDVLVRNNNNIIIIYNNNNYDNNNNDNNNNNKQAKSEFIFPQIKTVLKGSNSI